MEQERFEKLTQHEHVLKRPDTYIGSKVCLDREDYVFENNTIQFKNIKGANIGLERLFIEILTNAIDNVWNSRQKRIDCTFIKVHIKKDGTTIIKNDGLLIPISISEKYKIYNPELIFGHLLTSSNYDDSKTRITAGRNGLGGKLANIFSIFFEVVISDGKQIYTKQWTRNMYDTKPETIVKTIVEEKYTKITYKPDFKYFGIEGYSKDTLSLFYKYCYDASMVTGISLFVNFGNNKKYTILKISNLLSYAGLFAPIDKENYSFESKDCSVVIVPSTEFKHITFVNGAFTNEGGRHLDLWTEAIFRPIVDKLNKKYNKDNKKLVKLTIRDIKDYFYVFINTTVDKPTFNAQTKNKLVSPDIETKIPKNFITHIMKWDFVKAIEQKINSKILNTLNKGKKVRLDDKIDDAYYAGKKANECTLIICEGDSAKTYIVSGVGYLQKQEYIGIYPITGKLLNCRAATNSQKINNKVITGLQQILGLEYGVDYKDEKNFSKVRYSKVMVVADADEDGKHITGLIINFFDALFPSLIKRGGFLFGMKTPIQGIKNIFFYSKEEAKMYLVKNNLSVKMDYYKGLGSLGDKIVSSTFFKRIIKFITDPEYIQSMEKAFDKRFSNIRKDWIASYKQDNKEIKLLEVKKEENLSISDYINLEVITHAVANCERTLPHILDGFKEVQRKIFHTLYCGGSNKFIKLVQIGGEVNKTVVYHHGEQSLYKAIVGMAQSFVGSNNIPLLSEEKGQFGSRLTGGEDYGQPRYLATKLLDIVSYIFRKEDLPLFINKEDDGIEIEYHHFLPIIPFILVNGSSGIGTGWNTDIPSCNPLDLIEYIKEWTNETEIKTKINPYFRGFKGEIKLIENKYYSKGIITQVENQKTYEVTELPIGTWTETFKSKLNDLKEEKIIKSFLSKCTKEKVYFKIKFSEDKEIKEVKKLLNLTKSIKTGNMVMFDIDNTIKRFEKLEDIIKIFCTFRLDGYKRRKEHQLNQLNNELIIANNKYRFIYEIIEEKLVIKRKNKSIIENMLETSKYDKKDNKYDYLLHMRVESFTQEKLEELRKLKEDILPEKIKLLKDTDIKDIWRKELDELKNKYERLFK